MAQGQLQFELYDNTVAQPLEGGRIVVKNTDGEIVFDGYSDESGQSQIINLEAPPLEYSIEENEPKPYAEYSAEITADGFRTVIINGIEVYADSLALQRVYMERGEGEIVINVPPPTLWGDYPSKEPEEEVKPVPEESGFVVLDRVVIPEYVVVHDGVPGSDATNYYVLYKDYIKNVASSEIYSTWPDAAIRANVLAIQSFVLNRVFTEWYRNKGYNFTITNSTEYVYKW